jgi:hypothetical protein
MTADSPRIFLVTFMEEVGPGGIQVLGAYASKDAAHAAIDRAKKHPIFAGRGDLYWVDEYEIGEDDWPVWATKPARHSE